MEELGPLSVGASHHRSTNEDTAGFCHSLETRGNVYAIAEDVPVVFDDVS